nr:uncharacterized protein LOC129441191 [Misgurnus anguillicaudatus]
MAESIMKNNGCGSNPRPTTERHGTEPPNVTIDQMMENLNAYLDKRLEIRTCHDDICRKYSIKHSESGQWALPDIKRAFGKTQRLRTNTRKDGWSVILLKQIQQHLQKCEMDKLQCEIEAEKAKVRGLSERLQNEKRDKEKLLNQIEMLLNLISRQIESKDCFITQASTKETSSCNKQVTEQQVTENQQRMALLRELPHDHCESGDLDRETKSSIHPYVPKSRSMVRLAPVIVKNRRTEIEVNNEEEYEENGERQTRTVTKMVKTYVPHRTYQPATPEQIDKWSRELPDVYKHPRKVWQVLQRLHKIYTLHPLDGVVIINVNLRDSDQSRLTESVSIKVGESQENIEAGWEAVKTFLFELKPAEINWSKITSCMQKTGESVTEFEDRFKQTWLEHAGLNDSEEFDKDTGMPLKTAFVNGLKPEISKALKIRYDDWDSIGVAFNQLVEWSTKIERTQDVQLRALQTKPVKSNKRVEHHKHTSANTKHGRCKYCNKEGHWIRDCSLKLRDKNVDEDHLDRRFQQLTVEQKQTLLNAVQWQRN